MATAAKKKTAKKKQRKGLSETQRWVLGVFLFSFAVFLLVAVVSYYFYWSFDQNFVRWGDMRRHDAGTVMNPTGRLGAVAAHYLIGEWFGVFGIIVPIVLVIIALRIINYRPGVLNKSVRIGIIVMILGSLTLGFLFAERWSVFGTGLGGRHGIYIAGWIKSYLGVAGTGLVLLLGWVLTGVYISRRTITAVNKVGQDIYEGGKSVVSHATELVTCKEQEPVEDYDEPNPLYEAEHEGEAETPPWVRDDMEIIRAMEEDEMRNSATARAAQTYRPATTTQQHIAVPQSEEKQGMFTVVTPVREAEPEPQRVNNPREVMFGEEAGSFIVGGAAAAPGMTVNDAYYAGGVGRYAPRQEEKASGYYTVPEEEAATNRFVGRDGKVFTVVDRPAVDAHPQQKNIGETEPEPAVHEPRMAVVNTPLGVGGVVESASAAGVNADDRLQVVVAEHKDATLADDDIDESVFDPTRELPKYQKPPVELLEDHSVEVQVSPEEVVANKDQIVNTLNNFGIKIDRIKATIGPTVTLYEVVPAAGVKISKIKNLEDDIALSLKALGIRIIAPMPGQGTVGIEVPNKDKEIVSMYSMVKTRKFQDSTFELPIVLGKTISNETYMFDLVKMPHLLVAGATGQGKSVGLNAIITSLLYKKHPAELKFVLVDPKRVELSLYGKLERHFLAKMQSEEDAILTDTQRVVYTLNALCTEMSDRYDLLRLAEVKNIAEYNDKIRSKRVKNLSSGKHRFLPYIVVVIDEFADMIMTAGREVEAPITRLAQLARAVGIHLVIATQRPDVKVITGLIKANFPARIAFRVMSMVDSRTIIDQPGANQLIGRGDMLMSLNGETTRVQCAFIDTPEIERITEFIGNQRGYTGAYDLPDYSPPDAAGDSRSGDLGPADPMFEDVARFVVQNQQGSTSSIQRRFAIGYNRAGRIMDQLEDAGIVGRAEGSKPREVLIIDVNSLEHILGNLERD